MRRRTSTAGPLSCRGSSQARRLSGPVGLVGPLGQVGTFTHATYLAHPTYQAFRRDAHELSKDLAAAADHAARTRRDDRAAVSRCDGAGLLAAGPCGREAGASFPDVLRAQWHGDGVLAAER